MEKTLSKVPECINDNVFLRYFFYFNIFYGNIFISDMLSDNSNCESDG